MINYIDDIIVSCDGLCSMFNYIDDIILSCVPCLTILMILY